MKNKDCDIDPLFSSIRRMKKISHTFAPAFCGLTHAQFRILQILYRESFHNKKSGKKDAPSGLKIGWLAQFLGQAAPTISQRVNELEKLGFVVRKPDAEDRRITYVCLTEAGEEIMQKAFDNMKQSIQRVTDIVGEESIKEFSRLVGVLVDAAAKVMSDPPFNIPQKEDPAE